MGAQPSREPLETARRGLQRIRQLSCRCKIPASISELGIAKDAIDRMAASAMTVTRLLDRNLRKVTLQDAIEIYRRAF